MSTSLFIAMYRSLCRQTAALEKRGAVLKSRMPMEGGREKWGTCRWIPSGAEGEATVVQQLFPFLSHFPDMPLRSNNELRECIKKNFRNGNPSNESTSQALGAFKILREQFQLELCSSHSVTQGVSVDVTPKFLGAFNEYGGSPQNIFSYRIRVEYRPAPGSTEKVRLVSRSWMLKESSGDTKTIVPKGSYGVVGQTPTFDPENAQIFEYTSGCVTKSKSAEMWGSFGMEKLDSKGLSVGAFEAKVGPFLLMGTG
ncbi:hypothetical protein BSKO_06061 [Bryopsis sp. KO-2023]|nr:hypothetical protein BSKO_06061 [Bryopsis sp. KO-2023]